MLPSVHPAATQSIGLREPPPGGSSADLGETLNLERMEIPTVSNDEGREEEEKEEEEEEDDVVVRCSCKGRFSLAFSARFGSHFDKGTVAALVAVEGGALPGTSPPVDHTRNTPSFPAVTHSAAERDAG